MVISLAWLVFYYIQRFRYIHAKDQLSVSQQLKVYVFAIYYIRIIYSIFKILDIIHSTVSHRLLTRTLAPSLKLIQTAVITIVFILKQLNLLRTTTWTGI